MAKILENEKVLIQTGQSFLKSYVVSNEDLIKQCIDDCEDKLTLHVKRFVGWFSNSPITYKYQGSVVSKSKPLTHSMTSLLDLVNNFFNSDYNGLLINKYPDGTNFIHKHRDSKNHPKNGVVLISYGTTRTFRVFDNNDKCIMSIPCVNYSVLHMGGNFQNEFIHELQEEPHIKNVRYSISFHKNMGL